MHDHEFETLDQEWKEKTKVATNVRVPDAVLKGFSESVEKKILEGDKPTWQLSPVPVIAIAVAGVILIAGLVIWNPFADRKAEDGGLVPAAPVMKESVATRVEQPLSAPEAAIYDLKDEHLVDEIAVLELLGVWSEDDDEGFGLTLEDSIADLEMIESMNITVSPQAII